MILDGLNAIVYGGGGALGGAVARAFAREGAHVHLAGRTAASMDRVVADIRAAHGNAESAVIDVLDEVDVDEHVDIVAACSGSVDISINVVLPRVRTGVAVLDLRPCDVEGLVAEAVRSQFVTARAAARHMVCQHSGVILVPEWCHDDAPAPPTGALMAVFGAVGRLSAEIAVQLRGTGVRVRDVDSADAVRAVLEAKWDGVESGCRAALEAVSALATAAAAGDRRV